MCNLTVAQSFYDLFYQHYPATFDQLRLSGGGIARFYPPILLKKSDGMVNCFLGTYVL